MKHETEPLLRLCVVQLDVIPQALRRELWEPAEPRLDRLPDHSTMDHRKLSVTGLFPPESGASGVYQHVLDIASESVAARLEEVLQYAVKQEADVVVLPEYAVPAGCLPVLKKYAEGRAIVAGLGLIRHQDEAEQLHNASATPITQDLIGRDVCVLVHDTRVAVITRRHRADGEDMADGMGPIVATIPLRGRDVRLGVAVCLDYLRCEQAVREQDADVVCIPAYSGNVDPFLTTASRNHIRLFANCARYGGSTILAPGLADSALSDNLGARPVTAGFEAITIVQFDPYPQRPDAASTPQNRLVLRSEIIERDSRSDTLLTRLHTIMQRSGGNYAAPVTQFAADMNRPGGKPGPLAEAVQELRTTLQRHLNDDDLKRLAQSHLVVVAGNRPAGIRDRQARYVWDQLNLLRQRDPDQVLETALNLYRPVTAGKSLIFDPSEYIDRVLRNVGANGELPGLIERYALDQRHLNVTDRDLTGWVDQVVSLWRRQAGEGLGSVAEAARRLLEADKGLRRHAAYSDPDWWRDQIKPPGQAAAAAAPPAAADGAPPAAANGGPPAAADGAPTTEPRPADGGQPPPREPVSDVQEPGPPEPEDLVGYPLPPPEGITALPRDDGVVIRWRAPAGAPAGVRFTVERLASPGVDGREWTTAGLMVEDRDPPRGRKLGYRVMIHDAETDVVPTGGTVSAVFTPPVAAFAAEQVPSGDVVGRWPVHPDLHETQVRRRPAGPATDPADGVPIPSRPDGFHDRRPPVGPHVYSVRPVYLDPADGVQYEGGYARTEVVVVDPPPVPEVEMDRAQEGMSVVIVRWGQLPPGVSLMLRRTGTAPTGAAGDVLTLGQARGLGEPAGNQELRAGTEATVTLPAGDWVLVPFAVAGNLAVRGSSTAVEVIPAVTQAEAVRTGPEVLVSWDWPEGLRLARVVWRSGSGELVREVTRSKFLRHGGIIFERGEAAEIQISGMVYGEADTLVSPPVTVGVLAQAPTLTYHVHHVRPWQVRRVRPYRLHGPRWWCDRRRVVLTTDLPCSLLKVEIYVSTPNDPDARVTLRTIENLDLGPDCPHEVILVLPDLSALVQPRYLSCKAETRSDQDPVDNSASTGREIRSCFR